MSLARRLHTTGGGAGSFRPPIDYLISDAMSSWWVAPKAVESASRVHVSAVQSSGACKVWSFDPDDHSDADSFTLMTNESDDHNAAALLVPTDKPPIVAYARHNQDALLRYRVGSTIGDTTSLGSESNIALSGQTTYAQLWRRPGTDEVHVWTRERVADDPRYWVNAYSTNWATSWSSPRRVFDFGVDSQGYIGTVPVAVDPSRLRVALTGHPTSSTFHDVYYCEIDMASGEIENLAGTSLGNLKDGTGLPLAPTDLDLVVDTDTAGGHNARLFDVGDGPEPEVVWGDWTSDTNLVYYHRAWNGASWDQTTIVAAGVTFGYYANIHYNGGVMFPRDTPGDVVYLSRESGGTWYVERWALSGGSWSRTREVAAGSSRLVRPQPIDGATRGEITYHDASSYPVTATASLDWAADEVVVGA